MKRYSLGVFIPLKIESQYFYYDTNANRIVKVPETFKKALVEYVTKGEYSFDGQKGKQEFEAWLNDLKCKGFFSPNPIEKIQHPLYDVCEGYIENNIKSLLLQVTQQCNLLCRYCGYSSLGVLDRQHKNSYMSFDVAKKAIDYVFQKAKTTDLISISFYGGEPCANFPLLQKCVSYIKDQYYGCARYNMTTNFTLVNDRMLNFFVENEFDLVISIDGPREITNSMRRFKHDGKGVFDSVYNNLLKLRAMSPEYYKKHVSFNAVIDPKYDYNRIVDFFAEDAILKNNSVNLDLIDDSKNDYILEYSDEYIRTYNERVYKEYLDKLLFDINHRNNHPSKVSDSSFERNFSVTTRLPASFHHSGPCVAGSTRLFVDTSGNFYPCEKAAGLSTALLIGDVNRGIELTKVRDCLNIGGLSETQCKNCWASRFCSICAVQCDNISAGELSGEVKKQYCMVQRESALINIREHVIMTDCKRMLANLS